MTGVQQKVLVTGATGGLGKTLVASLLQSGFAVRATGRRDGASLVALGADYVRCDLTQGNLTDLTAGMDGIFHAAALSSPWGSDADFDRINVTATQTLLDAAKAAGCRRFVFVSSPSVYAREGDQLALTETDKPATRPLNAYARTKGEAERRVLAASTASMPCVAIRPRAIIGPDDDVLLPRFLKLLRGTRFPLVHNGRALVELTDVRDVVTALITAYDRADALGGEVINISGGRSISVRDMALRLGQVLSRDVRFMHLPYSLMRAVAVAAETLCRLYPGRPEPIVTVYSLAALSFSQTFDLSKARDRLSYVPHFDAVESALDFARQAHGR